MVAQQIAPYSYLETSDLRILIPASYPPESLVLFVMSTWHVLIALLISRAGVLRGGRIEAELQVAAASELPQVPEGATS